MDAHGGWIASAVDLARFAAALHDDEHSPLLTPQTIRTMHLPPDPPVSRNDDGSLKDFYYGCGWLVRPLGKPAKANYWHTGSLPGTYTLLVQRHDGVSWAILFNQRSDDKKLPDSEIDPALHRAANAVTDWPKHDVFQQYPRIPPDVH
jgi:N-acyl-D-amino-acid deacylase